MPLVWQWQRKVLCKSIVEMHSRNLDVKILNHGKFPTSQFSVASAMPFSAESGWDPKDSEGQDNVKRMHGGMNMVV